MLRVWEDLVVKRRVVSLVMIEVWRWVSVWWCVRLVLEVWGWVVMRLLGVVWDEVGGMVVGVGVVSL